MNRGALHVFRNPVLVGAATVLGLLVLSILAFNANSGLPFVQTYNIKAKLPNAQNLLTGNDVRVDGARIGQVMAIKAVQQGDGKSIAEVSMKLDSGTAKIPVDSTVLVRGRSAIGLKYLQITRGNGQQVIPEGGALELSQAKPDPVDFDQVLSTFDKKTRDAFSSGTEDFGTGFAGRGQALGEAIGESADTLKYLAPVMKRLADPKTGLRGTITALNRFSGELAAAAPQTASLLNSAADTLQAINDASGAKLQEAVELAPGLEDTIITSGPKLRPYLQEVSSLVAELRPGIRSLRNASPALSSAMASGTQVAKRLPAFTPRLEDARVELNQLVSNPLAQGGIDRSVRAVNLLGPTVKLAREIQGTCKAVSGFFKNAARSTSAGNRYGNWQGVLLMTEPSLMFPQSKPMADLHMNSYPNNGQSGGGEDECESGNEPYTRGIALGNPEGKQPRFIDVSPDLMTVDRQVAR